jgi:hypothetical protein
MRSLSLEEYKKNNLGEKGIVVRKLFYLLLLVMFTGSLSLQAATVTHISIVGKYRQKELEGGPIAKKHPLWTKSLTKEESADSGTIEELIKDLEYELPFKTALRTQSNIMKSIKNLENITDEKSLVLAWAAIKGKNKRVKKIIIKDGHTPTADDLRKILRLATQARRVQAVMILTRHFSDVLKEWEKAVYVACSRIKDLTLFTFKRLVSWWWITPVFYLLFDWRFGSRYEKWSREMKLTGAVSAEIPFHQFQTGCWIELYVEREVVIQR